MDRAKDAEIEGAVGERVPESRAEMMEGIMEADFHRGDLVSYHSPKSFGSMAHGTGRFGITQRGSLRN
jgi:hypothetical protein